MEEMKKYRNPGDNQALQFYRLSVCSGMLDPCLNEDFDLQVTLPAVAMPPA